MAGRCPNDHRAVLAAVELLGQHREEREQGVDVSRRARGAAVLQRPGQAVPRPRQPVAHEHVSDDEGQLALRDGDDLAVAGPLEVHVRNLGASAEGVALEKLHHEVGDQLQGHGRPAERWGREGPLLQNLLEHGALQPGQVVEVWCHGAGEGRGALPPLEHPLLPAGVGAWAHVPILRGRRLLLRPQRIAAGKRRGASLGRGQEPRRQQRHGCRRRAGEQGGQRQAPAAARPRTC
mmetsp:Transcript_83835/g.237393  ORF Transcript_83835/g.237393 Transcript_83835/m.237393 type:complete len:235 (+) Transcript_83835:1155-1859(+)